MWVDLILVAFNEACEVVCEVCDYVVSFPECCLQCRIYCVVPTSARKRAEYGRHCLLLLIGKGLCYSDTLFLDWIAKKVNVISDMIEIHIPICNDFGLYFISIWCSPAGTCIDRNM